MLSLSLRSVLVNLAVATGLASGARRLRQGVRVVNLHGTPPRFAPLLSAQLRWLRERFQIWSPSQFLAFIDGGGPPPREPTIVFSLDDGLANNATVAAPVLESFGIRALFFVCPGFIDSAPSLRLPFVSERIRPRDDPAIFCGEDITPMSWKQVRTLHSRGHMIGNHGFSHANFRLLGKAEALAEVRDGKRRLFEELRAETSCFAWTFSWDSISTVSWQAILDEHRYCFTPCPGLVRSRDPGCIWRTNIESCSPRATYQFLYSGLGDVLWSSRRRALLEMRPH